MPSFNKRIFAFAGYNTVYFGPGRPEFNPRIPMPPFESYLKDTANGTSAQLPQVAVDEGIIASFMSGRFLHQANLPGFLPFMLPQLIGRPCTAVEGACGSGGRAVAAAARSVLSGLADAVFVAGFEMQNGVKSVYGADILAGAAYYAEQRQRGHAYFFPGLFSERALAYAAAYDAAAMRQAMALWYQQAIYNARLNSKAQEHFNSASDPYALALAQPDPAKFLPGLNHYDCSKITDGASSIIIASEEGLKKCGVPLERCVEIVALGEAQGDITAPPDDLTALATTSLATKKALETAKIQLADLALLEIHDCFSISALLSIEAIGLAEKGMAPLYILDGHTSREGRLPTNLSGGLIGFGHPTGASGVRQLVDLQLQLTAQAEGQLACRGDFAMFVSMGGDDKTVTCCIVKRTTH